MLFETKYSFIGINVLYLKDQYDAAESCYQAITKTDLTLDPISKRSKRTDIGVILRMGQAQYFQGKRTLALDTFKKITNDPYLSTLNQKIPLLDREQAEHLDKEFRLADINHEIGLAYPLLLLSYYTNEVDQEKLLLLGIVVQRL